MGVVGGSCGVGYVSWTWGDLEVLGPVWTSCWDFGFYRIGRDLIPGVFDCIEQMEFARVLSVVRFMGRDARHGSSCLGEGHRGLSISNSRFSAVFQWGYMKPAAFFDGCE